MNLQQLWHVVATVKRGTMTAAARAVHVAEPVLSPGVRGIERELGLVLFTRRGRNVELTADGALAADMAR